ncbi:STAS domain-containing protein [Streptomyces tropicalis]|uniref:Anti-sigma factor antagonist n=1 Tax=Streptomyces tropicalis TaxID=3034234 RepID=A0ABT6A3A7_9ACTN|nr:STAS domain-containing protein [Streptomyces tropicalis]MDF3299119.1 STAS domain-containing protein [Streptomyces tropicalis]
MFESPTPSPARPVDPAGATVVTLCGAVDVASVPALRLRLDTLTAGCRPDLVLDLRTVPFIDCAGLGVLCRVRNRVEARDGRLRLLSRSAGFRRILRHTGLAGTFEVLPELAETPDRVHGEGQRPVAPSMAG